jgi:hypothetical protein
MSKFMQRRPVRPLLIVLAWSLLQPVLLAHAQAQQTLCERESALHIIQQQIANTRTFDLPGARISILIRGADLLWPYSQEEARTAFAEALSVASAAFKEKGIQSITDGRLQIKLVDDRFRVLAAIARRDSAWAKQLTEQLLAEQRREAEEGANKPAQDLQNAENLLNTAYTQLSIDIEAALGFARLSLRYPASQRLTVFCYALSEINRTGADNFYREALIAYQGSPIEQFLYLSAYPFGSPKDLGEMSAWTYYSVPTGFAPNPVLQELFIQTLLRRSERAIASTTPVVAGNFTEIEQLWIALTRIAPLVDKALAHLAGVIHQARGNLVTLLSQARRESISELVVSGPKKSFKEQIEAADNERDANKREHLIAIAVLNSHASEDLELLIEAAGKINDLDLRRQILSRLYFDRAQMAIRDGHFGEARRLASKVVEVDQRAYLYCRIVMSKTKEVRTNTQVIEMLEDVVSAAVKAPDSEVKARALFGVAHQYARIDPYRSVAVLGEVVKTINRIESPDFSRDYVIKKIETRTFSTYVTLQTPGFSPELSFREIGKFDLAGTLYQAGNLQDKTLRALTTLATVEFCLQNSTEKSGRKK